MTALNQDSYNPQNYACYAVANNKNDFKIYTVHPNGLKEYLDYDVYDIGAKTLIAFKKINFYKTDFVYRIIFENEKEEIFSENYEFISDVLNNDYEKNKYTFAILRSAASYDEFNAGHSDIVDKSRRCDLEDYAAVEFFDTNKENAIDIGDRNYFSDTNILGWTVFLSSMSNVYIVKVAYAKDMDDRAYKDWPCRVYVAETFPHVMKLAYQWSILGKEPWNCQDSLAITCSNAFDEWQIPDHALEELCLTQPETSVELYFNEKDNPRRSVNEPSEVPLNFKKWFMSKIRYRTLGSLLLNYPEELNIPNSMIEKEKQFFESEIYSFCIQNKMNPSETTPIEVLTYAYQKDSNYREKNNTITDIIKKNVYLEDRKDLENHIKQLTAGVIMGQS